MEESIQDQLRQLARILHWMEKYKEADMLVNIGSLLQLQGITDDEALTKALKHETATALHEIEIEKMKAHDGDNKCV